MGQFCEVSVVGIEDCMAMGSYTCRTICAQPSRTIPGDATTVVQAATAEQGAAADISAYYPTA